MLVYIGAGAIAFSGGFLVGAMTNIATSKPSQIDDIDWGAAGCAGLEYGVINTLSAFTCVLGGSLGLVESIALNVPFGFTYGSIALLIDSLVAGNQQ